MTDRLRSGDTIRIIQCRHCRHVSEPIFPTAVASVVPGHPPEELHHTCPKCGESQRVEWGQEFGILSAVVTDE